jgi:hypothetical protein
MRKAVYAGSFDPITLGVRLQPHAIPHGNLG